MSPSLRHNLLALALPQDALCKLFCFFLIDKLLQALLKLLLRAVLALEVCYLGNHRNVISTEVCLRQHFRCSILHVLSQASGIVRCSGDTRFPVSECARAPRLQALKALNCIAGLALGRHRVCDCAHAMDTVVDDMIAVSQEMLRFEGMLLSVAPAQTNFLLAFSVVRGLHLIAPLSKSRIATNNGLSGLMKEEMEGGKGEALEQ